MIDLFEQKNEYTVGVRLMDGSVRCIEETVKSISWGGSRDTAARYMKFSCQAHKEMNDFMPGMYCVLHNIDDEETELFGGVITKRSKKSANGDISYDAYDCRWYLTKNKHDKIYRNMTATEIILDMFNAYGIPYGELVDTGAKFKKIHIVGKTLWDTLLIVLTETTKLTGIKYTTKVKNGKILLVEKKTQIKKWVIEQGVNLLDATYEDSIENMYTQVVVSGKDKNSKPITATAKNEGLQKQFGVMQEYITQSEEATQNELNAIAAQKLRELATIGTSGSITTIGINGVEAGDAIYVIDEGTGMVGGFYVESDDHKLENRHHTMQLNLSWSDEVAMLEYEPPKEDD